MGQELATLQAQMAAKEVQISSMRGTFAESSPNMRQAMRELAALREQLGKFERPETGGANTEYVTRYRDFKYNEVLFEQLSKQFEMARLDESSEGDVIQVVDVAIPPERESNMPKPLFVLIVTLVSFFVLLVYVFVRRAMKNSGQDPEIAAKRAAIRAGFGRVLKPWRRRDSARPGDSR
jgi:uncharacterized protein involved in exopolysaccharide biosynthesis